LIYGIRHEKTCFRFLKYFILLSQQEHQLLVLHLLSQQEHQLLVPRLLSQQEHQLLVHQVI